MALVIALCFFMLKIGIIWVCESIKHILSHDDTGTSLSQETSDTAIAMNGAIAIFSPRLFKDGDLKGFLLKK